MDNSQAQANSMAAKAKQLPPAVQFAIVTALPNCVNGAFWGFTSEKDVREHVDAIKGNQNIKARLLDNACLIEVNPDYLYKACQVINPELMTQATVQSMQKCIAEAQAQFEKFLIRKAEEGKRADEMVCIYCTNDSPAVTVKGAKYPAFRVDITSTIRLLGKWGYGVKVGGNWVNANQAAQAGQQLWSSMQLSPTSTGVFIKIKCGITPDQAKQFKQNYGMTKANKNPRG